MELTPDTEELLAVITYSTLALFRRQLWRRSRVRANAILTGAEAEMLGEGDLLLEALDDDGFVESLAVLLPGEVHGAFWVQITEGLIQKRHCAINNFGRFELDDALQVKLNASPVLLAGSAPEAAEALHAVDRVAIEICHEVLGPLLPSVGEYDGSGVPLMALSTLSTVLLLWGLPKILVLFSRQSVSTPATGTGPRDFPDAFRMQARAAAHAAIYAYVVAFARVLGKRSEMNVPAIGVFWLDNDNKRVEFTAADAFRSLIEANLEPLTRVVGRSR